MPAAVLARVRYAQQVLESSDMRGHAEETRRAIRKARIALYAADDVLARRAGETLCRATSDDPKEVAPPCP